MELLGGLLSRFLGSLLTELPGRLLSGLVDFSLNCSLDSRSLDETLDESLAYIVN